MALDCRRLLLCGILALPAACGGGGGTSPTPPVTDNPNKVTITAAGVVSPSEIVVAAGSQVLFINNDSRPHQVASDPHPEHTDCPEVEYVGLLTPGQRRETLNLITARTCGFHDHLDPDNLSLRGRIVIR